MSGFTLEETHLDMKVLFIFSFFFITETQTYQGEHTSRRNGVLSNYDTWRIRGTWVPRTANVLVVIHNFHRIAAKVYFQGDKDNRLDFAGSAE